MITADLPLLPPEASRIPFASASAWQVAQALAYATERLAAHFPMLDWATWSDMFRDVKPDLVVLGPAVWLEGPVLERLVQRLAASPAYPVLDPPVFGPAAAEMSKQRTAHKALARQAQAELAETLGVCSPLLYELVVTLAQDDATVARVYAATHEPADEAQRPDPQVLGPPPALAATSSLAVDVPVTRAKTPPPPTFTPAPPAPVPAPERSLSTARRTFGDMVQHHPRANGKIGFTVRELCRAMRISAASLREAHANPGRLSMNAVSALATLMQEPLLPILADLLAGTGTRKKRRKR
jgi:hypothetical protein